MLPRTSTSEKVISDSDLTRIENMEFIQHLKNVRSKYHRIKRDPYLQHKKLTQINIGKYVIIYYKLLKSPFKLTPTMNSQQAHAKKKLT